MSILLDTEYGLGDTVCHRADVEKEPMIIVGYYIINIDDTGTVNCYCIDCSNADNIIRSYKPYELEILQKVHK